jgi:hypothetical protein
VEVLRRGQLQRQLQHRLYGPHPTRSKPDLMWGVLHTNTHLSTRDKWAKKERAYSACPPGSIVNAAPTYAPFSATSRARSKSLLRRKVLKAALPMGLPLV